MIEHGPRIELVRVIVEVLEQGWVVGTVRVWAVVYVPGTDRVWVIVRSILEQGSVVGTGQVISVLVVLGMVIEHVPGIVVVCVTCIEQVCCVGPALGSVGSCLAELGAVPVIALVGVVAWVNRGFAKCLDSTMENWMGRELSIH